MLHNVFGKENRKEIRIEKRAEREREREKIVIKKENV